MGDAIQNRAVLLLLFRRPKHALPQRGPVQGGALAGIYGRVGGGVEKEVGCRGAEVGYNLLVADGAWLDDFPRERIGVDYGEGVRRLGQDGADGGFAGGDGPREA